MSLRRPVNIFIKLTQRFLDRKTGFTDHSLQHLRLRLQPSSPLATTPPSLTLSFYPPHPCGSFSTVVSSFLFHSLSIYTFSVLTPHPVSGDRKFSPSGPFVGGVLFPTHKDHLVWIECVHPGQERRVSQTWKKKKGSVYKILV